MKRIIFSIIFLLFVLVLPGNTNASEPLLIERDGEVYTLYNNPIEFEDITINITPLENGNINIEYVCTLISTASASYRLQEGIAIAFPLYATNCREFHCSQNVNYVELKGRELIIGIPKDSFPKADGQTFKFSFSFVQENSILLKNTKDVSTGKDIYSIAFDISIRDINTYSLGLYVKFNPEHALVTRFDKSSWFYSNEDGFVYIGGLNSLSQETIPQNPQSFVEKSIPIEFDFIVNSINNTFNWTYINIAISIIILVLIIFILVRRK